MSTTKSNKIRLIVKNKHVISGSPAVWTLPANMRWHCSYNDKWCTGPKHTHSCKGPAENSHLLSVPVCPGLFRYLSGLDSSMAREKLWKFPTTNSWTARVNGQRLAESIRNATSINDNADVSNVRHVHVGNTSQDCCSHNVSASREHRRLMSVTMRWHNRKH